MRRSLLRVTNKNINYKIKKSILFVIFSFVFAFIGGNSVSALDIRQQSLEITGKSDTTVVHDAGIGDLRITPNLEFNRLNDYISYKLVIKNNDGKKYQIVGVTDDNVNEAIALSYSYPKGMDTNNKEIDFTVKYIKITNSPLKTINVTIKVIDEDDASEDIPIIVPGTGTNTSLDTVSAATIQTAIIYIVFAAICCAIYIIVRRKKTKEDEKASLRVPRIVLALALLFGFLPVVVVAAEFENIFFTVNLTKVQLNGPYIITFDTEGGTAIPPQIVNKGDKVIEPADPPEKPGYNFGGWVDENDDPYDFDTPVTGPVTIHTKWNIITYDIAYDLAGGTATSANPTTYTVKDTITLNNPEKDHHDFAGWIGTGLSGPTMSVTIPQGSTENRSYTATWKAKEYTADFNTDGGSPLVDSQTRKYGETFTEPTTTIIKKGYDFGGWLLNGALYNFSTPATKNIELKAKWDIITYDIDYDIDGGTPGTPANPTTYNVETETITLSNPTKDGYEFLGWVGSDSEDPQITVQIPKGTAGHLMFDASWKAIDYDITYDLGGGIPGTPDNPVKYNIESNTFTLSNPTRDGYTFLGWTGSNGDTPQTTVKVTKGTFGDLEYKANWNEKFTVTYDVNGGSAVSPETFEVENGDPIGTLATTNRDHYDFGGWYNGDTKVESDYIVRGNITLKAKWTPTTYNIYYVLPDEAVVDPANPTTYTIESDTFTLNNPTMAGYAFKGWTLGDGSEKQMTVTVTKGTTGDLHFNSHWVGLVTVEFDPKGGVYPNPDAYELEPGSEIGTLPEPTRDGYNFLGWYLGNDKIESDYTVTVDITLEAKWDPIPYTISYDLAGGSVDPANPTSYTADDTITLNNPTKDGHDFVGWTGTGLSEATETVTIDTGSTGNRNYTANWKVKEYTATFNTDGGTPSDIESQTKKYGEKFTEPTVSITKEGYELGGWLLGAETYDFSTPVSKDIELKAKWNPIQYAISYDLTGGSVDPANPTTYTIESDTFTLNKPTREHYIFTGWTGTGLSEATETVTINTGSTGDRSYVATWKKKEYTATFKDGDTVITTQTKEYEETFTEPTKPTKTGYDFVEWRLNGAKYDFSTLVTDNIELQAKWTPTTYDIIYNLDGGALEPGVTNPDTYTIETETFTINNPVMDGHVFKGWSRGDGSDPQMTVTIEKGTTGDIHLNARWVGLVTVEFNPDGGEYPNPDALELEENTPLPDLPVTTKDHYDFGGWYLGDTKVEKGYIVTEDITLKAKWTPTDYDIEYNLDGGTATNPATYNIETDTFTLNNPTKEHHDFDGWTGTGLSEPTKTVTINKGSSGDRSYVATWTELFAVTFDTDGGSPTPDAQDIRDGETASEPAAPEKTDYVFNYWMDEDGNKFDFSTPITESITLTAKWQVGRSTLGLTGPEMLTKIKQLANPSTGITSGNSYTIYDDKVNGFARADKDQYDAIKDSLTSENTISTGTSITATYMWFDDTDGTMYYYTEAEKVYTEGSMEKMFARFTNLSDLSGLKDFDTSGATDMNRLFQDSGSIDDTSIENLKDWDTSNVINMSWIFGGNDAAKSPNITKLTALKDWDVSKVKSFNQSFKHATDLANIDDISGWNVSSVGYDATIPNANDNKGFQQMFNGCTSLADASAIEDWKITNAIESSVAAGQNDYWAFDKMLQNAPARNSQPQFSEWGGEWNNPTNGTYNPNSTP